MSKRGYAAIGLHKAKTCSNIGSALRAVGVFGASLIAVSGRRYQKAPTDTQKTFRSTPLIEVNDLFDALPYDCVPVAIDIVPGARRLENYTHPERAFYIFGPEDGTLGKEITDRCRDVVYVDTPGPCMNLAAAVNVVLYDRHAKAQRAGNKMGES